ncbi:hypothetical protein ALC56_07581, partial [Trachymyrmex septentrionalis]
EWHEESINTIITYIMVLTAMMFNIFIFCFIGELVSNQCKKVGEVAYMTDWYQLPHKIVLGLILIILRSRIVTKITAGKIFHMSIQTFGVVSIMKIINITSNKIKIFSCKRVSEISYMIDWHHLPGRKALAIVLMIAMSNSSVKLTAGNIIELSMTSFGDCKRVSETSYMIDWHRLPGRKALAIVLMIAMSNSSIKLTAGNIIELSMSSFGDVMKTSVAYLNMLRTLTT